MKFNKKLPYFRSFKLLICNNIFFQTLFKIVIIRKFSILSKISFLTKFSFFSKFSFSLNFKFFIFFSKFSFFLNFKFFIFFEIFNFPKFQVFHFFQIFIFQLWILLFLKRYPLRAKNLPEWSKCTYIYYKRYPLRAQKNTRNDQNCTFIIIASRISNMVHWSLWIASLAYYMEKVYRLKSCINSNKWRICFDFRYI